ncbi:hypothetical protein AGMMS50218_10490 [Actinomycetota bacterium]|nr:hypothetical protein AGMMS50218_10490 [Actinomycetota bacterium]
MSAALLAELVGHLPDRALTGLGAVLAALPSPSPSPSIQVTTPDEASPGIAGFLVTFAVAIAAIGLFLSLTRHLRVVDRRARQREADDAALVGEAGEPTSADGADSAAPTGSAPDAHNAPDTPPAPHSGDRP